MTFNLCFCLPQRYGLVVFGCFKLIVAFMMIILVISDIDFVRYTVLAILLEFFIISDIASNILCLVGCFKKNPKLLRIYNTYSIGVLVLIVFTTVFYSARPRQLPMTLCVFIYQAYSVCLTENVIIELKHEQKRKNLDTKVLKENPRPGILRSGVEGRYVNQPIESFQKEKREVFLPIELCHSGMFPSNSVAITNSRSLVQEEVDRRST